MRSVPAPDFVVVGHVTRDLVPGGWRLGRHRRPSPPSRRTASGSRVGVVTRAGIRRRCAARAAVRRGRCGSTMAPPRRSRTSTTPGSGTQHVRAVAGADRPPPTCRKRGAPPRRPARARLRRARRPASAPSSSARSSSASRRRAGCVAADADGRVVHTPWTGEPFWRGADVLFVSDEDLADGGRAARRLVCASVPIVAMTEALARAARIYADGALAPHGRLPRRRGGPDRRRRHLRDGFPDTIARNRRCR